MKKLGLGIQDLSEFTKQNLIYVDKTRLVHKLIDEGQTVFSFPVTQAVFAGCWAYDNRDWQKK